MRELEECEGTLSALELNLQVLRATIVTTQQRQAAHATGKPLDERALMATLPPPRYDAADGDGMGHLSTVPSEGQLLSGSGDADAAPHGDVLIEEEEEEEEEALEAAAAILEEEAPTAVEGRAAALRQMCVEELGVPTFERVYGYLRDQHDDEDDERMRADLMRIMGESKLRLWPLVDQLVFIEDTQPSPDKPAMDHQWPIS